MGYPTFNGFSLNDDNFIAERITFKGMVQEIGAQRLNRREGIKLLGTEFGGKEVNITGVLIASSPTDLKSKLDLLKQNLIGDEGNLIMEAGRTYRATLKELVVPDEHYSQSKTDFEVTFLCSDPFATGDELTVTIPIPSGTYTVSGLVNISGTFFARPLITYTPPNPPAAGNTSISQLVLLHVPTAQQVTVSGFGSGLGLSYANQVLINLDSFQSLEGSSLINNTGGFSLWDPGNNSFTLTASSKPFPGGSLSLTYKPRFI